LLGDRLLLASIGYRLTSYIRANAGAVFFSYKNPAPFVGDETHFRAAPFVSAALDFDVFGVIAGKYKSL
jgi:hypothetical protein